ncbi:MAG: PAS domain S-box protein [Rhodospirillales bacterium]|nr:PAS domain S-box protein [Rhodospirillales bacterium]
MPHQSLPRQGSSPGPGEEQAARAALTPRVVRWVVLAGLALFVCGGSVATVLLVDRMERRAFEGISEQARTQTRLVQAQWTGTLARIDALTDIAARVTLARGEGDAAHNAQARAELLAALSVAGPPIAQVTGVDPDGGLSWSTRPMPDKPVNIADREDVAAILQGSADATISRPVLGQLSPRLVVRFGRAVRDDDGRLRGVTLVAVDTSRFAHLGLGLEQPGRSYIALLRDDGMVLARSDGQDVGIITTPAPAESPGAEEGVPSPPRQVLGPDGVQRVVVSRPVPGSGTTVVVALDERAMLETVHAATAQMWRWSLLLDLALVALGGLALLLDRQGRLARADRLRNAAGRAQEAFIRAIAEEASDLFAVVDSGNRFVYANPAWQTLLGMPPADLLGKVAGPCVAPDYRETIREVLTSLANGGGPRRLVLPMLHRDTGAYRWMEIQASHITWQGAGPSRESGCFFIGRDVTDRKEAEDALQQAREELETVARAGPGTLYRMALAPDGSRSLLYLANTANLYLGFDHEEASTPGFFHALLHPADRDRYEAGIASLRADGRTTLEYRLQDREGTFRWVRDTCAVTEIRDGTLVISGYVLDIDGEKRQAEALEQARRLLSLGEIASGLAHELNQPLAAIGLSAENGRALLAREVPAVDAAAEKFIRIGGLAARASATIESMRVFGRGGVPNPVPLDLGDVVRDALGVMLGRFEREGIEVVQEIPAGLPRVRGVAVLLQQVLINLLANACDAYRMQGKPGSHRIRIRAGLGDAMVWLEVADQAGGIPPNALPRIFEPFFTTKSHAGTGLGLAVSFGIVRKLGGSIVARNAEGGVVFRISLPACPPEDTAAAPESAERAPA